MAFIAAQWAAIGACAALGVWSGSWLVTALCVVVIATRQHALLVMLHDAAHYSLSANRKLNDLVGALFCAFPFSVSMRRYRANHLAHHRYANTQADPDLPDNTAPASLGGLAKTLAADLCFLSIPNYLRRTGKFGVLGIFREKGAGWWTERAEFLSFLLVAVSLVAWFDLWKPVVLYWIVPLFSVLQVILRARGYSEHAGRMDEQDEILQSRTIDAGALERFLLAPGNVNRHLEHHLYPSIPFFNLEKVHDLMVAQPQLKARLVPSQGYVGASAAPRSAFGEIYRAGSTA
ncbi:MAG: fatty acid desaturase family protein [Hyphomicrobiales bacterium]|nr:fatty acid desaturase family protein [Hyphomicrobiales bacterium]